MSLTSEDLAAVREVVREEVIDAIESVVIPRFDELEAKFEIRFNKIESDIKQLQLSQVETNRQLREVVIRLENVEGRLMAVENDIKELYRMIRVQPSYSFASRAYTKLPIKRQILTLHAELIRLAKKANISLSN